MLDRRDFDRRVVVRELPVDRIEVVAVRGPTLMRMNRETATAETAPRLCPTTATRWSLFAGIVRQ
jgi:hypothetical protein